MAERCPNALILKYAPEIRDARLNGTNSDAGTWLGRYLKNAR